MTESAGASARSLVASVPLGTRMTVRRKIEGGFTDALGYLRARSAASCTVETRRGLVEVPISEITAARVVPPPPERPSRSAR